MAKRYTYCAEITVYPHYPFPIDMLRYDNCYPAHSDDSSNIHSTLEHTRSDVPVTIRVIKHGPKMVNPFTIDRWKSFGVDIRVLDNNEICSSRGI